MIAPIGRIGDWWGRSGGGLEGGLGWHAKVVENFLGGLGIGCMPTLSHQVRYSGGQFSAPTQYASINIIRSGTPDGDFVAMGTVEVECPTAVGGRLFMQGLDQTEGGCTLEEAATLAQQKATEVGADGIFDIKTGVAANGRIASLLATTYKQQSVARIR